MKLNNLKKTLDTCIEYHLERGNETRVAQLREQKERVSNNHLENDIKTNGLYLGQTKADV